MRTVQPFRRLVRPSPRQRKALKAFSKAKARLDTYMLEELGAELPPWVIHDLRRTVRTRLSQLRISPPHTRWRSAVGRFLAIRRFKL
jgi:hypothetical protein